MPAHTTSLEFDVVRRLGRVRDCTVCTGNRASPTEPPHLAHSFSGRVGSGLTAKKSLRGHRQISAAYPSGWCRSASSKAGQARCCVHQARSASSHADTPGYRTTIAYAPNGAARLSTRLMSRRISVGCKRAFRRQCECSDCSRHLTTSPDHNPRGQLGGCRSRGRPRLGCPVTV